MEKGEQRGGGGFLTEYNPPQQNVKNIKDHSTTTRRIRKITCTKDRCRLEPMIEETEQRGGGGFLTEYNPTQQNIKNTKARKQRKVQQGKVKRSKVKKVIKRLAAKQVRRPAKSRKNGKSNPRKTRS